MGWCLLSGKGAGAALGVKSQALATSPSLPVMCRLQMPAGGVGQFLNVRVAAGRQELRCILC